MKDSKIGWTDDTYTPIVVAKGHDNPDTGYVSGGTYCVKLSPGCKWCYAEKVNQWVGRMQDYTPLDYKHMKEPPVLELKEGMINGWAKKKKHKKNFVSSMTDVFGEFVKPEWVFQILDAMVAAPKQVFQVCTKRAKGMRLLVDEYCKLRGIDMLPKNIWLIISTEDQATFNERVPELLRSKCQVRGLSCEPLLAPLLFYIDAPDDDDAGASRICTLSGRRTDMGRPCWDTGKIDWVIIGGESGKEARLINPDWVSDIITQCLKEKVPVFFKQWGEWVGGVWNTATNTVVLEDGELCGVVKLENGHFCSMGKYPLHDWGPVPDKENCRRVSVRAGKKEHDITKSWLGKDVARSDNEMIGGKHIQEFPAYYNPKDYE